MKSRQESRYGRDRDDYVISESGCASSVTARYGRPQASAMCHGSAQYSGDSPSIVVTRMAARPRIVAMCPSTNCRVWMTRFELSNYPSSCASASRR